MRIISNFHDYYDCGQRYGQDLSLIYLRNPRVDVYRQKLNYKKNETYKEGPFPFPVCYGIGGFQDVVNYTGKLVSFLYVQQPGVLTLRPTN